MRDLISSMIIYSYLFYQKRMRTTCIYEIFLLSFHGEDMAHSGEKKKRKKLTKAIDIGKADGELCQGHDLNLSTSWL